MSGWYIEYQGENFLPEELIWEDIGCLGGKESCFRCESYYLANWSKIVHKG